MKKLFVILACLLFNLVTATANERFYRNLSETGDYGGITINKIFKDSAGYVWLGSTGTVLRFDGAHVNAYNLPSPADKLTAVTSIAEIPGHKICIGTRRGAFIISSDSTRSCPEPFIAGTEVTTLDMMPGNRLLIGTPAGFIEYDFTTGNQRKIMLVTDMLSRSNHITATRMKADTVWVATREGVFTLSAADGKVRKIAGAPKPQSEIQAIEVSGPNVFLGTASEGLLTLDSTEGRYGRIDVGCNVVTSLDTGTDGNIYAGTDGKGIVKIDAATLRITDTIRHHNNSAGTPQSNQVYSLLSDDLGLLWIGYYQHGADYTLNNFGDFEIFNDPRYFNSRGMAIRTITHDNDFTTVGTRDGLLVIDRNNERLRHYRRPDLRSDMVISVRRYDGKFLTGTYGGGLHVLDPADMKLHDFDNTHPDPFVNGHIFSMTEDSDGALWIGTSAGLFHYDRTKLIHHFTHSNSQLPSGNVYYVYFDSSGKGWICTENGLAVYDRTRAEIRSDILPEGLDGKIRSVYEDADSTLYFLPEKGPIITSDINLGNISQLDIQNGADAKSIISDAHGCIWVTTNRGIVKWDKKTGTGARFGFADGIPSMNFTQCIPSTDSYGNLWFGNSDGLLKLDRRHSSEHRGTRLVPVPTDVLVEGSPYNTASLSIGQDSCYNITFDSNYANVSIRLGAFSYTAPTAVNYEYSLDGSEWQPVGHNLEITLYNLSGGKHRLDVRNSDDTTAMASINLSVPLSGALKIIITLCIMALAMAIYIIVIKLVHRQQRVKAAKPAANVPETSDNEPTSDNEQLRAEKEKYRSNRLKAEECEEITARMNRIIEEQKPFTNPDLKIGQLAEMTGVSSHKLSQVFSQHLNEKFYDYINRYRVEEFKRIATGNTRNRYTLSAMAEKAGFSSRASFFRHFKEFEGISPGEYIKNLENQ